MRISRKQFKELVQAEMCRILNSLEPELRHKAELVTILTADRPSSQQCDETGDEDDLLGLYEGISLTERHVGDIDTVDDQITLFRIPLVESCTSIKELREEIRITLLHELGHYFGFSEGELEQRGL